MTDAGAHSVTYTGFYDTESRPVRGVVPMEEEITLYVNVQPLVRLMCTPTLLEELALGFLFNEGLIKSLDEVAVIELCGTSRGVDVWLTHDVEAPQLRTITSGCSGGITFAAPWGGPRHHTEEMSDERHRIESDLCVTPQQVTKLMEELANAAVCYHRSGGVHTAALATGEQLVHVAEDVGRHNALDKIAGAGLRQGWPMHEHILLTTGRVSSEMVNKAARMGIPIVISRTSPTSLSIQLAQAWGLTLIGYTRRRSFRVYAGEERVIAQAGKVQ
jgi:FdhD protein